MVELTHAQSFVQELPALHACGVGLRVRVVVCRGVEMSGANYKHHGLIELVGTGRSPTVKYGRDGSHEQCYYL